MERFSLAIDGAKRKSGAIRTAVFTLAMGGVKHKLALMMVQTMAPQPQHYCFY